MAKTLHDPIYLIRVRCHAFCNRDGLFGNSPGLFCGLALNMRLNQPGRGDAGGLEAPADAAVGGVDSVRAGVSMVKEEHRGLISAAQVAAQPG